MTRKTPIECECDYDAATQVMNPRTATQLIDGRIEYDYAAAIAAIEADPEGDAAIEAENKLFDQAEAMLGVAAWDALIDSCDKATALERCALARDAMMARDHATR
jgi:hypothetical protein